MKYIYFTLAFTTILCFSGASQCVSGDCVNGKGVYMLPSGAKYFGNFVEGEIHGYGICHFLDNTSYKGEWKHRFPDGLGTRTYSDGTSRYGYWKKGQPVDRIGNIIAEDFERERAKDYDTNIQSGCIYGDCENGFGIFAYPNGSRYKGMFASGKQSGEGTFYDLNGDIYVGHFVRGLKEGRGRFYYANGNSLEGEWLAGEYVGNDLEFAAQVGCISGNCTNGKGVYVFPDRKGKYVGYFVDGLPHGEGVVVYRNGDRYEGQLLGGKLTGKGTYFHYDGKQIDGYWNNGSYEGQQKPNPAKYTYEAINRPALGAQDAKVWAVIVGIAQYNHMPVLRYTDDDAYRMYAFFKSPEGGALADENIRILVDEEATKTKIKTAMEEVFSQAGANDLVILYFSGHGLRGSFLPIDYDGYNNKFYHEEINAILKASPAKFKLCIADACHSGSLLAMRDGAIENILADYYESLAQAAPSTALIMSSKSEETSLESNSLRQGVFSHFLIRGLKGEGDANRDGVIALQELFDYIRSNVRSYTGMRQSPLITGSYDINMPVAVVRQ